jgi:Cytidylate kinase-like family
MQIITIYQGASGGGKDLAEMLSQCLHYRSIGREALVQASLRYGVSQAKLTGILQRTPGWWTVFSRNLERYRIAMRAAFCELAAHESIVYHGHLGHELVPKFQHVIKVLLTAPMEMRIRQVRARQRLNEESAGHYVEEIDKARTRRLQELFKKDWQDPTRYDLVVNLGYMDLVTAKNLIVDAAKAPDYQMTSESEQDFENFALVSRVRATLALTTDLYAASLRIRADQGRIFVSGAIPHWISETDLTNQIRGVRGVKDIKAEFAIRYTDAANSRFL